MRKIIVLIFSFTLISCKAQEKLKLNYITHNYNATKNKNFINDELIFLKNKDTLRINIKIPFDSAKAEIQNLGIFYNCHLKQNNIYTIELKKINVSDIPKEYNSYYRINTIVDENNPTKFIEIIKDTEYSYKGKYGMYVDIDNTLYQIIGLTPNDTCVFQH